MHSTMKSSTQYDKFPIWIRQEQQNQKSIINLWNQTKSNTPQRFPKTEEEKFSQAHNEPRPTDTRTLNAQ